MVQVREIDELKRCIKNGIASRNVGKSTLHDKSSRSHAFLEFELVSPELSDIRAQFPIADAELTIAKIKRDDVYLERVPITSSNISTARREVTQNVKKAERRLNKIRKDIIKMENNSVKPYIGGKFIFVDLAGNEFGKDDRSGNVSERKERIEINKSLLSLKECIRSLNMKKDFVGYRNHKLTMYLRRYLSGFGSKGLMISNIGPSKENIKKSINTIMYTQSIAVIK